MVAQSGSRVDLTRLHQRCTGYLGAGEYCPPCAFGLCEWRVDTITQYHF